MQVPEKVSAWGHIVNKKSGACVAWTQAPLGVLATAGETPGTGPPQNGVATGSVRPASQRISASDN
ncbi:MAG: hypothetical protein ABFD90_19465, partial [Phycisphaerales bacterium]